LIVRFEWAMTETCPPLKEVEEAADEAPKMEDVIEAEA